MGHLFLSYSRDDKKEISRVVDSLESAGYKVWIDNEAIQGGAIWRKRIVEAIESSAPQRELSEGTVKEMLKEKDFFDNEYERAVAKIISRKFRYGGGDPGRDWQGGKRRPRSHEGAAGILKKRETDATSYLGHPDDWKNKRKFSRFDRGL